jgi:general secretion pathway protein D
MKIISATIPNRKALFVGALSVFLSACAAQPSKNFDSIFEKEPAETASPQEVNKALQSDPSVIGSAGVSDNLLSINPEYRITAQASARALKLSNEKMVTVSFEEVPLEEFVAHVFSNILQVDFVIDPQTSFDDKHVTLQIKEPLGQQDFLGLFNSVLEQYSLGMKLEQGVVFLYDKSVRRGLPDYDYGYGRTPETVPSGANPIFHIVPIDYIDVQSMTSMLAKLTNVYPELMPDPNLIGLRAGRQDILRALDVVALIDRPAVRGQHLSFLRLDYVPVSMFVDQVTKLLTNEGVNVDSAVRFTQLNRLNGVIIHARNRDLLDRISFWRRTLDTAEATDDKQYFTYYPENIEATKLNDVLQQLVGMASDGFNSKPSVSSGSSSAGSTISATAKSTSPLEGKDDFRFVVDENRNVIIGYMTAGKYRSILPLLKQLDVTPPQVLIEARLLEVTLTDQLSQGVDWSLFGGAAKRSQLTSQNTSLSNGSFAYTISGIDYEVAISMLQNQDRIKVLSSPRIVVASGESASINVGTEIPVLATQSADVDTDRVLQSVQYRSTGVDLNVTPTVNSSSVISLEITQNVSETSENASSGIDSPIILNRSFKTKVFAYSGQALVLGGLIRENLSNKDSQVPFLGSVPGLGKLFSSESQSTSRTELIVLITPRIISNQSDIEEIKALFIQEFDVQDGYD